MALGLAHWRALRVWKRAPRALIGRRTEPLPPPSSASPSPNPALTPQPSSLFWPGPRKNKSNSRKRTFFRFFFAPETRKQRGRLSAALPHPLGPHPPTPPPPCNGFCWGGGEEGGFPVPANGRPRRKWERRGQWRKFADSSRFSSAKEGGGRGQPMRWKEERRMLRNWPIRSVSSEGKKLGKKAQ